MKRVCLLIIIISILSVGCSKEPVLKKYSYEFIGTFDTMIQVMGYAKNIKQFEIMTKKSEAKFQELSKLFDIYNDYEGINNIKTINDMAGIAPVPVDQQIIDLIEFSKYWYKQTDGVVNIAMGPVLFIWHEYRNEGLNNSAQAKLPGREELEAAAKNTDINKVKINNQEKTVYLEEIGMSLDVGAVAKGYAVELTANMLIDEGYTSFIISAGGNIKTVGKPRDGIREKWGIGLQNPDANPYIPDSNPIDTVFISDNRSVVSSGDYQRFYEVDGKRYHHIISRETLMPADYFRSVTVVAENSGTADFLSTAIFLLPYEQSRKLVDSIDGVEALWIMPDGDIKATENMQKTLKTFGASPR